MLVGLLVSLVIGVVYAPSSIGTGLWLPEVGGTVL